ncbi:MAG: aconitase X swivel domain-containing protein [Nitrososphaeraceae archaeon]
MISNTPINFLTMINAENGEIKDVNHDLYGKTLRDKIFVFPYSVGSSVGAYVLYSLKKKSAGPLAVVCSSKMDITTASGCAISNIPAVRLKHTSFIDALRNSRALIVDGEREQILIYSN